MMIKNIIKQVFSYFDEKNVKLIVYYGNKKGRDIDIFVLLNHDFDYNCLKIGKLDITYVGLNQAIEMAKNLDPLLTEPILFGDLIFGEIGDIKKQIIKVNSSKEIVRYLQTKAELFLDWAEMYFGNSNLTLSCDCMRFSLSFYLYSLYYADKMEVIDFKSILKIYGKEALLIKKAEILAKNENLLSTDGVYTLLSENRRMLTHI